MYKTINKLKTQQMIRVIELAEANKPKTIPVPIDDDRDEAATQNPTEEKNSDLKKQSQHTQAPMGTKSLMKGDYENMSTGRIEENKPNQSQFLVHPGEKGGEKSQAGKLLAGLGCGKD